MSRTINQIYNSIITQLATDIPSLNSPSAVALYKLYAYVVATSLATEEGLNDQFKIDTNAIATQLAPGTRPWIQAQAFKFQYSSTTPQIVQLGTASNFTPYYPGGTNALYQIITNCSVYTGPLNQVRIKCAKGASTAPVPLSSDELLAFQHYMDLIKPAGIVYTCQSNDSDKLRFSCTVTYLGSYASVISANLLTAYQAYLSSIPFDGKIILLDLLIKLRGVTGVVDVVINNASIRPDTTPFGSGTALVTSNTWINPETTTFAGYCSDETTSGYDFISQLTLQAI